MNPRFLVFMWLMGVGTFIGIWETSNLISGWHVDRVGVGAALIMFPIGFIGTASMWRRESLNAARISGMNPRFLVFMLLMGVGTFIGVWETINLINGWHVDRVGVGAALIMFPIGFIGTASMWRRIARSYRAALRKQRLLGPQSLDFRLTQYLRTRLLDKNE